MNLYEILQNPYRVGEGMTHFERLFAQKVGGGKINEIFGVPPLRYIGDGRPLTDYMIYGDTVQDGTPAPESHVPVVGCGTDTAGEWTLPPTVNGVEYPIYLGTVPTTRRVKKLVLTGEERLIDEGLSEGFYRYRVYLAQLCDADTDDILSSHYPTTKNTKPTFEAIAKPLRVTQFVRFYTHQPSLNDFKSYLAAQYQNGTPITVWYVLAEPETAVVNEPLMKIGDYADTISFAQAGVTIPTVSGENILDVPTEVPPSEVWIRGKIKEV